jgi:hypothetical protein
MQGNFTAESLYSWKKPLYIELKSGSDGISQENKIRHSI